jgi:hypothetical protein
MGVKRKESALELLKRAGAFVDPKRGKGRPGHKDRSLGDHGRVLGTTSVDAAFRVHLLMVQGASKRGAYAKSIRRVADQMKLHPDHVKTYARRHRTLVAMYVRVRRFSDELAPLMEEFDRLSRDLDPKDVAVLEKAPFGAALHYLRKR